MEEIPLPPTAQVVADVIGRTATLELAKRARYRAIYVPYRMRDNHWIAKTVGRRNADLLSRHLGGMLLPLAKCESVFVAMRDAQVIAALEAGASIAQVMRDFNLSERHIRRIRAK